MFAATLNLRCPGLFVTGTDTGVGKTVISCAVVSALREQLVVPGGAGAACVGVSKPLASGCEHQGGELINEDALALARFSNGSHSLSVINPIRYRDPVAPAVAAEEKGESPDLGRVAESLELLSASSDALIVEGVGGVMAPLDSRHTVLDLAAAIGYPVLVVTRAGLGTLNHTAMTVTLLREVGCRVAGLVVNGMPGECGDDLSIKTNVSWLKKMNDVPVLAVIPACRHDEIQPAEGCLSDEVLTAVGSVYWPELISVASTRGSAS